MSDPVTENALRPVITDKGLEAALAASTLGKPAKITHVGLTERPGEAAPGMEALPGEALRLKAEDGTPVNPHQVSISVLLREDNPGLSIHGIGFYLEDGTLFAVYQSPDPLLNHTAGTQMLVSMDVVMGNIPGGSITVEATGANLDLGGFVKITRKVNGKELREDITLTPADIKAAPESRTINGKPLTADVILGPSDVGASSDDHGHTAAEIGAVPVTRKVNKKALDKDITLTAEDVGGVPATRKVNNKTLSVDITLGAEDVGAVPKARKVNDKPLSSDITLSHVDVGAVPTGRKVNNKPLTGDISLNADDVGAVKIVDATAGKTDLNTLIYDCHATVSPGCPNWPWGSGGSLIVSRHTANYVHQLALIGDTGQMAMRYLSGTRWSEWERVYSGHDKPTPDVVGAYPMRGGNLDGSIRALGGYICAEVSKNPAFEWHSVGKHAFMAYVPDAGGLVFANSDGQGGEVSRVATLNAGGNDFTGRVKVGQSQGRGWNSMGIAAFHATQTNVVNDSLTGLVTGIYHMSNVHLLEFGYGHVHYSDPDMGAHTLFCNDGGAYIRQWVFRNNGALHAAGDGWNIRANGDLWSSRLGNTVVDWAIASFANLVPDINVVGSYALCSLYEGPAVGYGTLVGGGSISPNPAGGNVQAGRLAGTWKCLGWCNPQSGHGYDRVTLFQRVA